METMDNTDVEGNPKKAHCHKRQESWVLDLKDRAFKMASTVVLPRNRRVSGSPDESLKSKSISTKSLPPKIQHGTIKSRRKMFQRSISAHNEPQSTPHNFHRVLAFEAQTLEKLDEGDEVDSTSSSCKSSQVTFQGPPSFMRRDLPPSARSLFSVQRTNSADDESPQIRHNLLDDKSLNDYEDEKISDDDNKGYEEDEDDDSIAYKDYYNCLPPPVFMLSITVAEIAFFVYHAKRLVDEYGYIGKFRPAPLDSFLIYNPTRRYEIWRYLTYAFVHSGYMHLINNVVVQLVLGILLEMVHKWWRVLAIYFAGVLAGSLATSIVQPFNYIAGASAGVYALIAAHLSTVILNWGEMEYPWIRILVFLAFVVHDGGTAIYYGYILGETTNVGYVAHGGGVVAGLLVGIHVLKNLEWKKWEEILWWICVVICIFLLVFSIAWNIFRSDLFP